MMNNFMTRSITSCMNYTSIRVLPLKIWIQAYQKLRISTVSGTRDSPRANGSATILAIGTANPPNIVYQKEYPDFYFGVTNCEHMIDLKDKFKRICEKSAIRKRHMYITQELLKENPQMCDYNASSLDTRKDILRIQVPQLGKIAGMQAIHEWGQPMDKITHLIFCTMAGVDMPGADYHLVKFLHLPPSVNRFMLYHQGCYAGGTALRLAKDIAENNPNARVLVVCSEMTVVNFPGPTENHVSSVVSQALFGDGEGAMIVAASTDLDRSKERPIFELARASQTLLANTEGAIEGQLKQAGLHTNLHKDVPKLISNNIMKVLVEAFDDIGVNIVDWNSLFWAVHPGGRAILDELELELGLERDKLRDSRYVSR